MTENGEDEMRSGVKFPPLLNNQPAMAAMSRTIQKEEENKRKNPLSIFLGKKGARDSHQEIMSAN